MRVVDLSHVIQPGMPMYPGTEPPLFECGTSIERDGFVETRLTLFSHTGTHMDAPAHLLKDGPTLDRLDVSRFIGPAVVIPAEAGEDRRVTVAHLKPFADRLARARFAILRTGWATRWGGASYFGRFPVLDAEAAAWLARLDLYAVGVDAISVDPMDAPELPNHRVLLARGCCIVENLTNLGAVGNGEFTFACLPLRLQNADGSPVRAVALLPD